jgi:hypothetical protein
MIKEQLMRPHAVQHPQRYRKILAQICVTIHTQDPSALFHTNDPRLSHTYLQRTQNNVYLNLYTSKAPTLSKLVYPNKGKD